MLEREILLCALVAAPTFVGLLILARLTVNERRDAERHREMLERLGRWGGAEVAVEMAQSGGGPESPRILPAGIGRRSCITIGGLATRLCPNGPRPTSELAEEIGRPLVPVDLPSDGPAVVVTEDAILYRPDERSERSKLEGIACVALVEEGLDADHASVQALVAELTRPRAVPNARSAG